MPAAQVRAMLEKIKETKAENHRQKVSGDEYRRTDPVERAKSSLQRAGYVVYRVPDASYVVGRLVLSEIEMMEYAARIEARRKAKG